MNRRLRMHPIFSFALGPSLLLLASGCANAPLPAPVAPIAAAKPVPPPPDVTAVPAPDLLVVYGRVANPAASAKIVTDWAALPPLPQAALFEGAIGQLMGSKEFRPFAALIDADKAIDFAVSLDLGIPPKGLVAVAAALKEVDAAKSALATKFELVPADNGVIRLIPHPGAPKNDGAKAESDEASVCEIAPAAGSAPFRLVCGSSESSLKQLGPYLTRTTPRQTVLADIHLELHAGPIAPYAALGRTQAASLLTAIAGLSEATTPAALALMTAAIDDVFDLVRDMDTQTFDVTLDRAHAGFTYRTTFKTAVSLVARMATEHPDRVDVPPEAFWHLPADVDLATFGSGIDDSDLQHPRDLLVAALEEHLKKEKAFSEPDRHALTQLLAHAFRGERGVFAHGMLDTTSYWLMEQDEPFSTAEKTIREMLAVWSRPGVAKWLKSDDHAGKSLPVVKLGPPIAGLPKGVLHVIVTVPSDAPSALATAKAAKAGTSSAHPPLLAAANPPGPPDVYHFVAMPDGARTWFAISTSEAALKKALRSVAAAAKGGDSLGGHATERGLAGWKETRMSTGAFVTVRGFLDIVRGALGPKDADDAKKLDAIMGHIPGKGMTPMLVRGAPLVPTADDAAGIRDLQVDVPAEAIHDAVWVAHKLDD